MRRAVHGLGALAAVALAALAVGGVLRERQVRRFAEWLDEVEPADFAL